MPLDSERSDLLPVLRRYRPFFDNTKIVEPGNSFVAWLDVMGASSAMQRSHMIAANFVMKLHAAVLDAGHKDMTLYPVIDGVYMVTHNPQSLLTSLADVLLRLSSAFLCEKEPLYRFMARGAIAYGPVIEGQPMHGDNPTLLTANEYRQRIVLGIPLTQAHEAEPKAAPFGVFIHESARLLAHSPVMRSVHWRWWRHPHQRQLCGKVAKLLREEIEAHFDWCLQHSMDILYEPDRINLHRELAKQYFGMLLD